MLDEELYPNFEMRIFVGLILIISIHNLSGQCLQDRHNTSMDAGWLSCSTEASPNPARGSGHWILYNLGRSYELGPFHFWNYNNPDLLDNGARRIAIDYSNDGQSWGSGPEYIVPMADGSGTYSGFELAGLGAQESQFILITILENHGGSCSGFGELRIGVENMSDCLPSYELSGDLTTATYRAIDYIRVNSNILSNSQVRFEAGNEVSLVENFQINAGSELIIAISDCSINN